jgi:transposase-like protein
MRTEVECPYCGKINSVLVEDGRYFQKQIVVCDLEEGGCDKDFVVETRISINATCKKIEGEFVKPSLIEVAKGLADAAGIDWNSVK